VVSDCQTSVSKARSVACGLMLTDFSGDTSRDKDPEAGSVKQQQGYGWQGLTSMANYPRVAVWENRDWTF